MTVAALAAELGVHRSSASRFAATLVERGFLERVQEGEGFRLGPTLGRLGLLAMSGRDLVSEAREAMVRLSSKTGEAVVLSVLEDTDGVDIAQVSGSHRIGTHDWVGRRTPLHASSDGKIFLAFASASPTQSPRRALTDRTITDMGELNAEIERVRERGWATAVGELEAGLNGVAVPVRDGHGRCVAALSVSGPAYRMDAASLPQIAVQVERAAAEITQRLAGIVS